MTSSAKSILDIPQTSSFPVPTLLPSSSQISRVLDMMRFNCTYNPDEVAQIRTLIEAIPAEIARCDSELASCGRFSEVVAADRVILQNVLDRCKSAITSPIRKLPPDVLLLIFRECRLASDESCGHVLAKDRDRATLQAYRRLAGGDLANIAQVCYQWNMLVDTTPALWSSITMDMRLWETQGELEDVPGWLIQAWMLLYHALRRGGGIPVDVEAVVPRCHPLPALALASSSARWRSANIHIDSVMSPCLDAVHHHLPLLEKLHLRFIRENVPEGLKNIAKFFSDAPQLKVLDYCGPIDVLQHLPMEQLRRFSCSMLAPEDILPFTSLLPRLSGSVVHAHLNIDAFADNDEPLALPLVESSLQELCITATDPTGSGTGHLSQRVLGAILDALRLPSLARFYLLCAFQEGKPVFWPHPQGLALLQRSKCEGNSLLETLHLHNVVITERELIQCLGELPTLRDLHITDHPAVEAFPNNRPHVLITDTLLQRLSPNCDEINNSLAPMLASVHFETVGKFTDPVLLDFIQKRVGAVAHWDIEEEPFDCCVSWIPGYARELGEKQAAAIEDMERKGELEFTMYEDDLDVDEEDGLDTTV
ncbi:F-box domain-containing protein [Favolaschia claudopus]|uniref:F-box domain-containing protein n=1 Tax=Favolaschia claudopus TaxID=2862362 RepID=A0AAW0CX92_9AGAR